MFSPWAPSPSQFSTPASGELEGERTEYLFREIVAGIAGYGNTIGVPTVGGEVQFDPCYEQNPLVNAMAVGLVEHEGIRKGLAAGPGTP